MFAAVVDSLVDDDGRLSEAQFEAIFLEQLEERLSAAAFDVFLEDVEEGQRSRDDDAVDDEQEAELSADGLEVRVLFDEGPAADLLEEADLRLFFNAERFDDFEAVPVLDFELLSRCYLDGFLLHARGLFVFFEQVVRVALGLYDDPFEQRDFRVVVDELGRVGLLDDFFLLLDFLLV